MRTMWIIFSVLSFIFFILISNVAYTDYQVFSKGESMKVKVIEASHSQGTVKFNVHGKMHSFRINRFTNYSHKAGDTIEIKYLNIYDSHVLPANENPLYMDALLLACILFCSIAFIRYAVKNAGLKRN